MKETSFAQFCCRVVVVKATPSIAVMYRGLYLRCPRFNAVNPSRQLDEVGIALLINDANCLEIKIINKCMIYSANADFLVGLVKIRTFHQY